MRTLNVISKVISVAIASLAPTTLTVTLFIVLLPRMRPQIGGLVHMFNRSKGLSSKPINSNKADKRLWVIYLKVIPFSEC